MHKYDKTQSLPAESLQSSGGGKKKGMSSAASLAKSLFFIKGKFLVLFILYFS